MVFFASFSSSNLLLHMLYTDESVSVSVWTVLAFLSTLDRQRVVVAANKCIFGTPERLSAQATGNAPVDCGLFWLGAPSVGWGTLQSGIYERPHQGLVPHDQSAGPWHCAHARACGAERRRRRIVARFARVVENEMSLLIAYGRQAWKDVDHVVIIIL